MSLSERASKERLRQYAEPLETAFEVLERPFPRLAVRIWSIVSATCPIRVRAATAVADRDEFAVGTRVGNSRLSELYERLLAALDDVAQRPRRLAPYGIHTALDLAQANRRLVRSLLTVVGEAPERSPFGKRRSDYFH